MSSIADVPVFYRDDDESRVRAAYTWTRAQCREAKNIVGRCFDNGKKFRLFKPRPQIFPVTAAALKTSNHIPQASTISNDELFANVGIAGSAEDISAPRHLVKRAQQKIAAYMDRDMREKQAVTAYGRWYASENIRVEAFR